MGWCSGSYIYDEVIKAAKVYIPDVNSRTEFHKWMIDAFENGDWDCQDDCRGEDEAFDAALDALHPEWKDDDSL